MSGEGTVTEISSLFVAYSTGSTERQTADRVLVVAVLRGVE